ncbi:MAG: DUF4402 domain-containing protein [Novosphingobium sp.]
MRNSIRLATLGALLSAVSVGSVAHAADTATATASAEVLSTIAVTKDLDLSFGQIAVNGTGTVALAATGGAPTCSAQVICAGTTQPAEFTITGADSIAVVASVVETSIDLVHATDAAKKFTLDNFGVAFQGTGVLTGGVEKFNVGGTLNVDTANALAGVYAGTFTVSVDYN